MSQDNDSPQAVIIEKPIHYPHLHLLMPDEIKRQIEEWVKSKPIGQAKYFKATRLWVRIEGVGNEGRIFFLFAILRPDGTVRRELEFDSFLVSDDILHLCFTELSYLAYNLSHDDVFEEENPSLADHSVGFSIYSQLIDDGVAEAFFGGAL